MTLEDFLRTDVPLRKARLRQLEAVTLAALEGYTATFDDKQSAWPYKLRANEKPRAPGALSFSTTAMNLLASNALLGRLSESAKLAPCLPSPLVASLQLEQLTSDKSRALAIRNHLTAISAKATKRYLRELKARGGTSSKTFGSNDPFTFAWSVAALEWKTLRGSSYVQKAKMRVREALKNPSALRVGQPSNDASAHALPILMVTLLNAKLRCLDRRWHPDPSELRAWLEQRLHQQLSLSHMPNASFDAPELIFCTEALMRCDEGSLSLTEVLERVAAVIQEHQSHNPNLRPYRPMLSDERGFALLPLTVEIFNSLLRLLELVADDEVLKPIESSLRPVLDRYADWILSQRRQIKVLADGELRTVVGWYSEHTQAEDVIHVWETSQVVLFLSHYTAWLRRSLQRDLLDSANFSTERPVLEGYMPTRRSECAAREPCKNQPTYAPIWDHFIAPFSDRSRRSQASYSALLSGPPGTGKTRFAQFIAASLGWPLITLTPSDFLVGGEGRIEERAKAIFRTLEELRDVVVLFDEIDRLILDRDSTDYGNQSETFQFMTPSMLVKLNDLRARRSLIFLVATNYEERIDPAIKRAGRIDLPLLVLPPDAGARRKFFDQKLRKSRERFGVSGPLRVTDELVQASALFTFPELIRTVESEERHAPNYSTLSELLLGKLRQGPSLRIQSYLKRLGLEPNLQASKDSRWPQRPTDELRALAKLCVKPEDKRTARQILAVL